MPVNTPVVGEIYNAAGSGSDQWLYVYETKGPYVYLSGIHQTHSHQKMRRPAMRGVVNDYNYGSNGLRMEDGNILGLAGSQRAEGVLFLEGEDLPV